MARPKAKDLTERELEVMQAFWARPKPTTVAEVRDDLAGTGRDLAYTTVATLVRILHEKGYLEQTNAERPFQFRPTRSHDDVSRSLIGDMVDKLFDGSREMLLLKLFDRGKLSAQERATLQQILEENRR